MTKCRKKGRERGCDGEEREGKDRKEGREDSKEKGGKEGRERGRKRGKRRVKGERGREEERALLASAVHVARTLYERNPRRRRWAVVHLMHAYARLS